MPRSLNFPRPAARRVNGGPMASFTAAGLLGLPLMPEAHAQPATPPPAAGDREGGPAITASGGSFTVTFEGGITLGGGEDGEPIRMQLSLGDGFMPFMSGPGLLEVQALLRPEFIRRDLEVLVTTLSLDADQSTIAESLLEDYAAAFLLASEPLSDALRRFRRQESDRTIARVLEGANEAGDPDLPEGAQLFVFGGDGPTGIGGGGGVVAIGVMIAEPPAGSEAAGEETEPPGDAEPVEARPRRSLLERVRQRMADAERAGEVVTAEQLVRLGRGLRTEREILRAEFIELLGLVAEAEPTEAGAERLAAVLARIDIEHRRPRGRLAAESLHLEAVLAGIGPLEPAADEAGASALRERTPAMAEVLAARAEATLDREIAGLLARAEADRQDEDTAVDEAGPKPAMRRFVAAVEREFEARLAVRMLQRTGMDAVAAAIAATDPAGAERFLAAARRSAFSAETRPSWAERAIEAAAAIDGLEPEVRAAIDAIDDRTSVAVRELQDRRIAWRLEHEPKVMQRHIQMMLGTPITADASWGRSEKDLWARQDRIDAAVEQQLAAILTPEQSASLPSRPRRGAAAGNVLTISPGRPTDS